MSKTIQMLGYASGLGAALQGAADGPLVMQESLYLRELINEGANIEWQKIISPPLVSAKPKSDLIIEACQQLAQETAKLVRDKKFFTVLGGDHSSAIGTWSGVSHALKPEGSLGMIWVDAHMDSHTPETTPSGNIHGMPVACLLGRGLPALIEILNNEPKIKPENLALIGIRSFEEGEAALLKELNVRIFYMDEVKERGLQAVMQDALRIATQDTEGLGISIDIDGLAPEEAPGTGYPVAHGIAVNDLIAALKTVRDNPLLTGVEIVEFDPHKDKNRKTEKVIARLLAVLALGYDYVDFKSCCKDTADASC
jgi:arginase